MSAEVVGSNFLESFLNLMSQSLKIPVIIFLIIFAIFAILSLGTLIAEYRNHRKFVFKDVDKLVFQINMAKSNSELKEYIQQARLPDFDKDVLNKILDSDSLDNESRIVYARNLIEESEYNFKKVIERTDTVTRIGPTLGLMGTLIPMGPGLAALGSGDVTTLASAMIVAFDTTVIGVGAGALAYVISKIRKRWYSKYLSSLDVLIDALLVKLNS